MPLNSQKIRAMVTQNIINYHLNKETTILLNPQYNKHHLLNTIKNCFLTTPNSPWHNKCLKKDTVVKDSLIINDQPQPCIIKYCQATNIFKTLGNKYLKKNNKAERIFNYGLWLNNQNIPTANPIACIVEKTNARIIRSACIYEYLDYTGFHLALGEILKHTQDNSALMKLLTFVAKAIKHMHDSGFIHGDLGNQNILIKKQANTWQKIAFIDVDRSKVIKNLSLKQRAKDFNKIYLPSNYRQIFLQLYWGENLVPETLNYYYQKYRNNFIKKNKINYIRRPLRHYQNKQRYKRESPSTTPLYPKDNNTWLWDEKTAQAMVMLTKKDKNKYRDYKNYLKMSQNIAKHYRAIKQLAQINIQKAYKNPINMQQRIGIALHPYTNYIKHESSLLSELQNLPVLIRFGQHETKTQWDITIAYIKQLHQQGIRIAVAFLQNRNSVLKPNTWHEFLSYVLQKIHHQILLVEIGHAINRVKWGVWSTQEYLMLLQSAATIQKNYPHLKITGPAVIDFDWPNLLHTIQSLPKEINLAALSQHLYVDRRGAPENYQGDYSTLEKCALSKAIAQHSAQCENKLIISEVNWPLKNTQEYSPIAMPHRTSGYHDPVEVSPDTYAAYMVRYLLITLCSGLAEQVYWWRLSAHGYGLIDDLNNFSRRPAYYALKTLLAAMQHTKFIKKLPSPKSNYLLYFEQNHKHFIIGWTTQEQTTFSCPFKIQTSHDLYGKQLSLKNKKKEVTLTQYPVYFII